MRGGNLTGNRVETKVARRGLAEKTLGRKPLKNLLGASERKVRWRVGANIGKKAGPMSAEAKILDENSIKDLEEEEIVGKGKRKAVTSLQSKEPCCERRKESNK